MPPPSTQSDSQHNEPTPRKRRRKRDDPQSCFTNSEEYESDDCSPMSCSDVESFQGKIVYNPDGSAYIIDSENESLSNIPENCISAGSTTTTNNPKIHSFRVVTARDACVNISELNKIQKPILMCFICKLSFGNTKSFSLHANSEHTLNLQESEKLLLNREYSSAILQRNVDEKPQISFLEPLDMQKQNQLNALTSPQKQQQEHQQQLLISSTSSTSLSVNSNNSCSSSCSKLPTTLSSSSSSSVGSVSSVAAAAAAAAANAALVAAIAASCSNTSLNTSTSLTYNPTHMDSDLIMASLSGVGGGGGNSNTGYGSTTGNVSNNPSSSSSNCSQMIQQRSDDFDNLNTLDLSAVTAAAQAAAVTSIVNSRPSPPPSSPTSTTSSSPSSSSSSASTLSLSAQQPSTAISASGLPAPISIIANEPKSHSLAMDTISATFSTSSPATKLSSSNSSNSVSNTLSNKNNSSALLPPTPTTVADFLHQQFQNMQNQIRITSPSSSIVVSASGSNTEMNTLSSSVTTSTPSLSSLTASLAAAAAAVGSGSATDLSSNSGGVKLINDFLQHQFQQQQQHHQQHSSFSTCPEHPDMKGIDCKTCEMIEINIKSPITPTRSPNSINLFPSNVTLSPTAAAAPSFTIGACPEHINGRPLGVDCSRCEMILNSARLNSGVQMSTRNSCKTLKCPQCNWHYKYQETLEIHMREKHPDGESACGYCLAGQQHPRLARGESYTCGYKPYRCEICNYSTTTKGNLSIHMQSDKHLNNMQELNSSQNMATTSAEIRESPKIIMPNMQQQASKPKPSFRCDVCSYETSVARNLRIHMTSEKHTHNMAVLQNNIKHIQAFSFLQSQNLGQLSAAQTAAVAASNLPNIPNLQNFLPEAALADIAYNQALMIQLLHQNSAAGALSAAAAAASPLNLVPPQHSPSGSGGLVSQPQTTPTSQQPPQQAYQSLQSSKLNHLSSSQQNMTTVETTTAPSLSSSSNTTSSHSSLIHQHSAVAAAALLAEAAAAAVTSDSAAVCLQQQHQQQQQQQQFQQQDSSLDPPIDPDPKPTTAFSCLICANYNTNSIDELNNHLMIDRSRNTNNNCSDIMMIINNNYICRLCNYKTNLKANFQLHSKTDKHLQKLNYINHIREGGVKNEYKLKYNQTNTVQLKCNCCDFYTNSIQKLNLHTQHMRHDTMKMIFNHLLYLVNTFNVTMGSGDSMAAVSENSESQFMSKNKVIMCQLCNYSAVNILQIVQHVKSLRHIQVEQFICLQRRSENLESLGLDDVFKIADNTDCIKSERSSPAQSLESHQLLVKQENEKMSAIATTTTTTTAATPLLATTTTTTIIPPAKSSRDIYTDSSPDHQQNVSSSSAASVSKISNCNKELADVDLSSLPSIIYKCNNCDYFAQTKSEMQNHISNIHPNVSAEDFLTIPTNPAALHAFHAAVAAAAVAVAENAAASQSRSKSSSPSHMHMQQDDRQQQYQQQHHDQEFASVRGNKLMHQVKTEHMDIMDDAQSNDECEQLDEQNELLSSRNLANVRSSPAVNSVMCPLCQDTFSVKKAFEIHLMGVHSVNSDGLARLLQLVDNSHWLNSSRRSSTSTTPEPRNSSTPLSEAGGQLALQQPQQQHQPRSSPINQHLSGEEYACTQCGITFKLQQHLLMHANDAQHYQIVNEQYQCLAKHCQQLFGNLLQMLTHYKDSHMNIVISERHVYKYRCKQCSLAFKTQEKLNTHSLYHTMRDATKCMICNRNFRSTQSLQKHMEQAHSQLQPTGSPIPSPNSSGEIANAPAASTPLAKAGAEDVAANSNVTTSMITSETTGTTIKFSNNNDVRDGQDIVSTKSITYDSISVSAPPPPLPPPLPPSATVPYILLSDKSQLEEYLNSQQISEESYTDAERKLKCHKCKVAYTNQSYLAKHYKSNQHRRNEKLNIYPLEKFLDPNRPFKCEVCRESFTQKNILLVHFNSVSHLHKAKKQQIGVSTSKGKFIPTFSDPVEHSKEIKGYTVESVRGSGRNSCGGDEDVISANISLISKRKVSLESDYESPKKRFKCEICKVAYAQGSTLDIHMRSVLHQTRSCRLQEHLIQPIKSMTPPYSSESPTFTTATTPVVNDHMCKSLLETFGFDIVKQFNEINKISPASNSSNYYCRHCSKEFSSIFVLKTHCEEIHSEQIPLELLEKFAEKFKNVYLNQQPTSPTLLLAFTNSNQNPNPCFSFNESENNLGATTSAACSDSNSPSPVVGEPASRANETSSMVPSASQLAAPTSPNTSAATAAASALLKQQQQQSLTPDLVQKLNLDPTMLAQKIMEQNFANFPPNFPGLPQNLQSLQSLQSLQNLQNMQQNLPNMGNMPMNTLDMLNLMQFHHLMSLNFMNLAPPLIFGAGGAGPSPSVTGTTSTTPSDLPSTATSQQQTSTPSQNTNNQKRARTRITDDQLKILRAHFDINNSPSEESIMEMSKKANLPMKVVKHWFRNTLFKERQRNKDSPYNFNNPPSTTLNLEEYERTGQTKVTPLSESGGGSISGFHLQQQQQQREQQQREQQQREHQQQQINQQQLQQQMQSQHLQQQQQRPPSSQSSDLNFPQLSFHQQHDLSRQQMHQQQDNRPLSHPSSGTSDRGDIHIKPEPTDDIGSSDCDQQMAMSKDQDNEQSMMQSHQQSMFYNNFETKSESGSSEILSRPQTPNSTSTPYSSNISDILGQQMDSLPLNNMANISNLNNMGPPKKFQMNKMFEKSGNFETNSNSSNSSTSSGKRANRTRFTDYQIKVLQEFFENNSYPKDSDLEYLSKLLLLSPRVIVVWFQNARQKQRKIYENQPNNSFYESEEKKPNINYACKKCNLVFQRYYELIRHQKNHCFKEENNKKSAKAQIAAAQIAQSLSSEDSNSSIDINSTNILSSSLVGPQAAAAAAAAAAVGGGAGSAIPPVMPGIASSPGINLLASPQHIFKQQQTVTSVSSTHMDSTSPLQKFECEKCQLVFNRYELYKEHQLIHLMNPNLFMNQSYSESSPFGILQNHQGNQNNQQDTSIDLSRQKKRKHSDTQTSPDELHNKQADYEAFNKKFKNDQYEFLYQYFLQNDSNSDLKNQFQQQQQQTDLMDLEYLNNFYQQNELKKRSNYDFLLQYYMRNESKQPNNAPSLMLLNDDANKPNMEFLLQYYQLSESKKFFQLEASPQRIHDFPPLLNLTNNAAAAAVAAVNNGVSAQQHQVPQQVSAISPSETLMKINTNLTTSSPSSSPVHQHSNNSSCGIDSKDMSSNNNSSSKNCQTQPALLTENAKLLSVTVSTAGGGRGNGGGVPTATLATTTPNAKNTGNASFSSNLINSLHCPIIPPQQQENSSLVSNCLDATPIAAAVATLSDFAVQSIKLSVNNNLTTNAVSKTSPITNTVDMMDADLGVTSHHQQHDSSATSISSASHHLEETVTTTEKQNSKRLRTTILPEQLNFLYECYQNESNPSRKMLEDISKKVNLKKRVVQVWYQNSRARERKGQFRQNIQIINKKCPHCAAIFKIKSALEWHLQSKHGDKQAINIDQIPDLKFSDGLLNLSNSTPCEVKVDEQHQKLKEQPSSPTITKTPPATLSPIKSAFSVASVVTTTSTAASSPAVLSAVTSAAASASIISLVGGGTTPLDLSKTPTPFVNPLGKYEQSESDISFSDSNNDHDESNDFFTPSSSLNNGNLVPKNRTNSIINNRRQYEANLIDSNNATGGCSYNDNNTMSNISDYLGNERENTNSPVSQSSSNNSAGLKKRFRTQMSNLQVRILKTLFYDVKTPSMTDCSNVGREIGLGKRVIQVWFQNARAKEKKSRNQRYIHDENTFENDKPNVDSTTSNKIPEIRECNICQLPSVNIQEHAFSAQHIAQVRVLLEVNGSNKNDDNQQHVETSTEHEFNDIYSKMYTQHSHHKNETADSDRIVTNHYDKDDTNVDYHCSNILTNPDCGNNDKNYDTDENDNHDQDNDHDNDNDEGDYDLNDDKIKLGIQNEDMALNEANKAALALRNFNKLQQHFAAATAFAKQQQQYPQQLQQQPQCDIISSASPPSMENNLMLKINTDKPLAANHSEMLQQLFSYSQMSGEFHM